MGDDEKNDVESDAPIKVVCPTCKKEYLQTPEELEHGSKPFCSKECGAKEFNSIITLRCHECKRLFKRRWCYFRRTKRHRPNSWVYCCVEHSIIQNSRDSHWKLRKQSEAIRKAIAKGDW